MRWCVWYYDFDTPWEKNSVVVEAETVEEAINAVPEGKRFDAVFPVQDVPEEDIF